MPTAANSINEATTGICGFNGTSFTATAATQYNVQVGGATTSTLASVAPSATVGVPLVSAGAAVNPAFGTAVVAGGGTGATSFTAYAVTCGGTTSTGALQSIAGVGTSGQVLTSNGAGALPTFQTAAGGGAMELISTGTASSSATIDFTGLSSTYFAYVVYMSNVVPVTNSVNFIMRTSTNNGSSYDSGASDYKYVGSRTSYSSGPTPSITGSAADSSIEIYPTMSNTSTDAGSFCLTIYNPSLANTGRISWEGTASTSDRYGSGIRNTAADIDAIRFLMSSGNISTGTFKLYGIKAA